MLSLLVRNVRASSPTKVTANIGRRKIQHHHNSISSLSTSTRYSIQPISFHFNRRNSTIPNVNNDTIQSPKFEREGVDFQVNEEGGKKGEDHPSSQVGDDLDKWEKTRDIEFKINWVVDIIEKSGEKGAEKLVDSNTLISATYYLFLGSKNINRFLSNKDNNNNEKLKKYRNSYDLIRPMLDLPIQIIKFKNVIEKRFYQNYILNSIGRMGDENMMTKYYLKNFDLRTNQGEVVENDDFKVHPDIFTYNTLINHYSKFGLEDKMLSSLGEMSKNGVAPDNITLTEVAKYYADSGREIEMVSWFDEFYKRGVEPDTTSYNVVIHYYCRRGNEHKMTEWLNRMQNSGRQIDLATFNMILYLYSNKLRDEEKTSQWMAQLSNFPFKADTGRKKKFISIERLYSLFSSKKLHSIN